MAGIPKQIGRYQIVNLLGTGGMGAVYLAHDPQIDRAVAIKLLRDGFDDAEMRERFAREASAAGRLHHPNIVTIYDIGEHEGVPFIAMEFVPGDSLARLVRQQRPVPLARKIELMQGLSSGLSYAHRAGIVHRDVKPANLLIDSDGVLKILDFGIARVQGAHAMTQAGMLVGTLNYMAPEQVQGLPGIDARADMFAAGVVFYELLAYKQPFQGDIASGILVKLLYEDPEPLETLVPDLDADLAAIVARCLRKSPDDRYPDMAAVQRDLAKVRQRLPEPIADEAFSVATPVPGPAAAAPAVSPIERTVIVAAPEPAAEPVAPAAPDALDATLAFFAPGAVSHATLTIPDVQLVVTRSPDSRLVGHTVRIGKQTFTIGRDPDCDLNLPDSGWSRDHAEIQFRPDGFVLQDRSSRNGTYVDGRAVKQTPLLFGAVITVGQTDLTFSYVQQTVLPDLTGCGVASRYTLLRLLRESAKGAVYAGKNDATGGDVAIKLLSPDLCRYQSYRDSFRREAQIAARLVHPHICPVMDYGPATVKPRGSAPLATEYLCSRLMAGGSLLDRLDARSAIGSAEAADWLAAIAGALDEAHGNAVIHGALKPGAIVFDGGGHPYLTDFAIGQQAPNADGRPLTGTPAYMAPELWDDGNTTPASDQFALAAIFYYVVTGSRPFEGQEYPDVRARNFRRGAIPAHEEAAHNKRDKVPRAVSTVLARALAADPAERFETASAFAAAFKAALRHVVHRTDGPEVFISYQRDVSAPLAMYFADRLKAQGILAFIDTQGIDRAGRFPPQIERAIEDTDVFICLLADTTLDSSYVLEEIRAAHRFEKPMIPVMQESYRSARDAADPAVAALLAYQGLPVLDRRNLHLEHTAGDLVRLGKSALAQRDRD